MLCVDMDKVDAWIEVSVKIVDKQLNSHLLVLYTRILEQHTLLLDLKATTLNCLILDTEEECYLTVEPSCGQLVAPR